MKKRLGKNPAVFTVAKMHGHYSFCFRGTFTMDFISPLLSFYISIRVPYSMPYY